MSKPHAVVDLNAERQARGLEAPKNPRGLLPFDDLSFMRRRKKGGPDYWAVEPKGSYAEDYETGRQLAQEYLTYIGEFHCVGNGALLVLIVQSMGKKPWRPVNTAFLSCVNRYAMAAATVIEGVQVEC